MDSRASTTAPLKFSPDDEESKPPTTAMKPRSSSMPPFRGDYAGCGSLRNPTYSILENPQFFKLEIPLMPAPLNKQEDAQHSQAGLEDYLRDVAQYQKDYCGLLESTSAAEKYYQNRMEQGVQPIAAEGRE